MKKNKIWGLLCVLIIVFMLVGCSSESGPTTYSKIETGASSIIELPPNQKLVTVNYDGAARLLTRDMRVDEIAETYYFDLYIDYLTMNWSSITIIETKE